MAASLALPVKAVAEEDLQALAGELLSKSGAPGAAVGLWQDGQAGIGVAGVRRVGAPQAVEVGDPWHIGSNAKAMTAVLVARLAERGVVRWDDTVAGVLGGRIEGIDPAFQAMTYADLLSHRAGLPANAGLWTALRLRGTVAERDIRADRVAYAASVLTAGPEGVPGEFLYSNAGYVVAGAMLEEVTGESWEDLIRAEVFGPLGMTEAGFGPPMGPDVPMGHSPALMGGLKPVLPGPEADNIPALGPAGTVHLPVADMLRFLAAVAERKPGFLTPDSWARLTEPPEGRDYAMGWRVEPDGSLRHNGSNTLWFSAMGISADGKRAAVLMLNAAEIEKVRPVTEGMLDRLLDAGASVP